MKTCFRSWLLWITILSLNGKSVLAQVIDVKEADLNLTRLSASLETLSQQVSPAVVQVFSSGLAPVIEGESAGTGVLARQHSIGSGMIVDSEGYIITNAHVVEGAQRVQVLLPTSSESKSPNRSLLKAKGKMLEGQLLGLDRESDLALVKVDRKGLPFVELGDSDGLRQGQVVLAFGAPLGLANSVTMGVVSGVARQLKPEDPMVYIQTDTPINPGSSGGPLVDGNGRVIGINTFILSQSGGSEGIGFAIPSNIVRNVYRQLKQSGKVRRGVIGVYAQTITPLLASCLGLPQDWGVIISDVPPGGPAHRAGIKEGDLVLTLDRKVMENARQFNVNLYRHSVGDNVVVEVLRDNLRLRLDVRVIERADDPDRFAELADPRENLVSKLGILGVAIDPKISQMLLPLRKLNGVVVAAKLMGASSGGAELQTGDVIYSVNRTPVKDVADLNDALKKVDLGDSVLLQIERHGQVMYQAFELE
ncbi:MAG: peptidase S1 [Acidobacteria bacterium]|nr:MAG: peptidase S1 [Acidobacteriota bacterium]